MYGEHPDPIHEMKLTRRKRISQKVDASGMLLGLLIAGGIMSYQIYYWGTTLEWFPMPVRIVFEYLDISLVGVDKPTTWVPLAVVAQKLLVLPLSITAFFLSLVFSNFAGRVLDPDR